MSGVSLRGESRWVVHGERRPDDCDGPEVTIGRGLDFRPLLALSGCGERAAALAPGLLPAPETDRMTKRSRAVVRRALHDARRAPSAAQRGPEFRRQMLEWACLAPETHPEAGGGEGASSTPV